MMWEDDKIVIWGTGNENGRLFVQQELWCSSFS